MKCSVKSSVEQCCIGTMWALKLFQFNDSSYKNLKFRKISNFGVWSQGQFQKCLYENTLHGSTEAHIVCGFSSPTKLIVPVTVYLKQMNL